MEIIPLAVWGFLVGFVGWGSFFRLVEPIGNWLIPVKNNTSFLRGWIQIIIVTFLIIAILILLALLPMLVFLLGGITNEGDIWRKLYGTTFISSLLGLFVWGLITRIKC